MGNDGAMDDLKGRVKGAAGELTGDDDLKREGKVDKAKGWVKDKADDLGEAAKDITSDRR